MATIHHHKAGETFEGDVFANPKIFLGKFGASSSKSSDPSSKAAPDQGDTQKDQTRNPKGPRSKQMS